MLRAAEARSRGSSWLPPAATSYTHQLHPPPATRRGRYCTPPPAACCLTSPLRADILCPWPRCPWEHFTSVQRWKCSGCRATWGCTERPPGRGTGLRRGGGAVHRRFWFKHRCRTVQEAQGIQSSAREASKGAAPGSSIICLPPGGRRRRQLRTGFPLSARCRGQLCECLWLYARHGRNPRDRESERPDDVDERLPGWSHPLGRCRRRRRADARRRHARMRVRRGLPRVRSPRTERALPVQRYRPRGARRDGPVAGSAACGEGWRVARWQHQAV